MGDLGFDGRGRGGDWPWGGGGGAGMLGGVGGLGKGDDVLTTAAGCFLQFSKPCRIVVWDSSKFFFFSASYEATICRSFLHVDILLVL